MGLTKLLVEIKFDWSFICGPNEAPGRSQVMRSFICGPNEAPSRSLVVWSFTCGPNEAPSRSLVKWPWYLFVVLCF
jgi:hypothetical protein